VPGIRRSLQASTPSWIDFEPAEAEGESLRPRRELFPYPLLAALLLGGLAALAGTPALIE
jgi:hypothetical protein